MLRKKLLDKDGSAAMGDKTRSKLKSGKIGSAIAHSKSVPFKFHFDILITTVKNVKDSAGKVLVIYERRNILKATTLQPIQNKCAEFNQNIAIEATIYRNDDPGSVSDFDEKLAKIAIRMDKPDGKTIGKLHVNLANYARVPSGSVYADFKMSNGSIVNTKIDSRLLVAGKKKKKNADDTSSMASGMSAMTTGSGGLSMNDDQSDCSFLDESFGSDLISPGSASGSASGSAASPSSKKKKGIGGLRSMTKAGKAAAAAKEDETAKIVAQAKAEGVRSSRRLSDLSSASEAMTKMRGSLASNVKEDGYNEKLLASLEAERKELVDSNRALEAKLRKVDQELEVLYEDVENAETTLSEMRTRETRHDKDRGNRKTQDNEEDEVVAEMEEELAELEEIQRSLKDRNEELISELSKQVEAPESNVKEETSRQQGEKRAERLKKMEKEKNALIRKLDRDQRFLKLAEDLSDVKMTLAFATMEKDQAVLERRNLEQQLGGTPGPSTAARSYRSYGGYGGF